MGYRYYDTHNIEFSTGFPFGHGLSYTTFGYSSLQVTVHHNQATVEFELTNSGATAGAEVAQLYLGFPTSAGEPPKQLKGFLKQHLLPGESGQLAYQLTERDFSVWSSSKHAWQMAEGEFAVYIGSSSRDIRLTGSIQI